MKTKLHLLYPIMLLSMSMLSFSCPKDTLGCKDPAASNYDITADANCSGCCVYPPKQGGVLFYLDDPMVIPRCGNVVITISNGKQTTITGFYNISPPANCVNQVGGYVLLDVGTYQYTVTSKTCAQATGTITVVEGCNKIKI
jgi:hypothetical protein